MNTESPHSLSGIKHILLILSGKGGVGKSSVTTQLGLSLAHRGFRVGILDIDLTGPSVPRMFGVEDKQIHQSSRGWVPVRVGKSAKMGKGGKGGKGGNSEDFGKIGNSENSENPENPNNLGISENLHTFKHHKPGELRVISLGFLLPNRGDAVVWRGPKKTAMIRQFIKDVDWGDLDYLLIDTPPGTSDEHIVIAEELRNARPDGAVLVTTPQNVSVADVKREINFCGKVGFNLLGIVENMSGYVCPHCGDVTDLFSRGGGRKLSEEYGIPFLGTVPIDPQFVLMIEKQNDKSAISQLLKDIKAAREKSGTHGKEIEKSDETKKEGEEIHHNERELESGSGEIVGKSTNLQDLRSDNSDNVGDLIDIYAQTNLYRVFEPIVQKLLDQNIPSRV